MADFSAIEARVTAWFAGEEWKLQAFRDGQDIYCATASQMFHVPVVKHGINGELRQKGKVAELACGYGGGVNALKAFGADKMGMTDEEMQDVVDKWRDSNANVAAWWKTMENAAVRAVARQVETVDKIGGITFSYENGVLFMKLPSGRRLAYWGAAYGESRFQPGRKTLSYMGVNQQTKKWSRVETWGGKLVENAVQATARDVLREAMFALDEQGYQVIAHVHDECIVTEPITSGRTYEDMAKTMCPDIPWAKGLPLEAAGYDGDYYFKD